MTDDRRSRSWTRAWSRGGAALKGGLILLVLLIAANVYGWMMGEVAIRGEQRWAPPTLAVLQRLLWIDKVRDTVEQGDMLVLSQLTADSVVSVFRSSPPPSVAPGTRYTYRPETTVPLREFTLRTHPPGLSIDPATGEVSGVIDTRGKYEVVLEGRLSDDRRAVQSYVLFVDDRFLLLGADASGRDVFLLLLRAARLTLLPGFVAVLVGVGIGTVAGALAGFYGGTIRRVLQGLSTVMQSIPGMLLLFLTVVVSEFNLYVAMVVVGVILLPETANGLLERVEQLKRRDFVEAARELGMRDRTILWNEIVWHNARTFVVGRVTQGFAYAVLVEVTLSYMGLAKPNSDSLGELLRDGRRALTGGSSNVEGIAALFALVVLILTFSLLERGIVRAWDRRRA